MGSPGGSETWNSTPSRFLAPGGLDALSGGRVLGEIPGPRPACVLAVAWLWDPDRSLVVSESQFPGPRSRELDDLQGLFQLSQLWI